MRIIVALASVSILAAQSPREQNIARAEARVEKNPESPADRSVLLRLYVGPPQEPIQPADRDARRRHILWLIEHHPEANDLGSGYGVLEPDGLKADPEGFAQAERLWRDQIAKRDLAPKALANAAWFFKFSDRPLARALLDRAPGNPATEQMRGIFAVLDWLGATALDTFDVVSRADPALRKMDALDPVEGSRDAALVGGAGAFLLRETGPAVRDFADPADTAEIAARWLEKACALEPENEHWRSPLADALQRQANGATDPRVKVQFLSKAVDVANKNQRLRILGALADAEFLAAEDAAAERDANGMLQSADPDTIFSAHTLLGRLALDRGDVDAAKKHLLDSARSNGSPMLNNLGPKMTLAQELLDRGERDAVVQFLELCRAFWKNDRGFIDHFKPIVQNGGKPNLLTIYNPNRPLVPPPLPAPVLLDGSQPRWRPVPGAESYVVEWDVQKDGHWMSDPDGAVRVAPTRETTVKIDYSGPYRWRVFAVGRTGRGNSTNWRVVQE